jgi:hypothetical protein
MINGPWEQAEALLLCAFLIFGMMRLSWYLGTKYWSRRG